MARRRSLAAKRWRQFIKRPGFIGPREAVLNGNMVIVRPLGWKWGRRIEPKRSVIDHRGRVVHEPPASVLKEADRQTALTEPVEVRPGTMWDRLEHVFGKPEGGLRKYIQTPHQVRIHGQFVRHSIGGRLSLHHLHLSPVGRKPETHLDRFVLGRERKIHGRKWVEAHPMRITPDGSLEVYLEDYVLIKGTRARIEHSLRQSLKEQPTILSHFLATVDRFLTGHSRKPRKKT